MPLVFNALLKRFRILQAMDVLILNISSRKLGKKGHFAYIREYLFRYVIGYDHRHCHNSHKTE